MTKGFIERAVDALAFGDQDDGAAVDFKSGVDVFQRAKVVFDVFDDIEADDGIHLLPEADEVIRIGSVHHLRFERGTVGEAGAEALHVFAVEVRCDVTFAAGDQLAREIAHAGANFEDAFTDVGADGVSHPAVEVGRVGKSVEDGFVGIGIDVRCDGVFGNHPDGFDSVFQADFLAFFVCPAVVADGDFEDFGLALGEFDGDFGLETEAIGADGDGLQQRGAEGLVAGLHIGQVEISDDVAHSRQRPVGDGVPVV